MPDPANHALRQLVFFSDLDGTLLDRTTYSWSAAAPALEALRRYQIPLVLVTSKTEQEVAVLRGQLQNSDPFVVENGAITIIPEGYFPKSKPQGPSVTRALVQAALAEIRAAHGFSFQGFAEMGEAGICEHTGLDRSDAAAANARVASEPILWTDTAARFEQFASLVQARGLHCVQGGRFIQVSGPRDKGAAVAELIKLFRKASSKKLVSIALGDAPNDSAMLDQADIAVVVKSDCHSLSVADKKKPLYRTSLHGPGGWCEAVMDILAGWPHTPTGE